MLLELVNPCWIISSWINIPIPSFQIKIPEPPPMDELVAKNIVFSVIIRADFCTTSTLYREKLLNFSLTTLVWVVMFRFLDSYMILQSSSSISALMTRLAGIPFLFGGLQIMFTICTKYQEILFLIRLALSVGPPSFALLLYGSPSPHFFLFPSFPLLVYLTWFVCVGISKS